MVPSLSLLSCELLVSVKENLIQKKKSFQYFTFLKRWIRDIWKWHMSTIKNGKILYQKITVKWINHVDLICHFDFLAMISLFRLLFLLKMARSCYIVILRKLKKGLELVFSFQYLVKNMLEIFVIWPNFIFIVLRIQKK